MDDRSEEFESARREVHSVIDKLGDQVPPKMRQLAEDAIIKMKVEGLPPREVLGFTPEMLEVIYRYGYNLFQSGKYKEALGIFDFLRRMDVNDVRYSFGIAACYHYSKDYLDAAANYIICSYLEPFNPLFSFHLYDCFMKSNYPLSALRAIEETIILSERNPKYTTLKEKALLEKEHLKTFLKEYLNKESV